MTVQQLVHRLAKKDTAVYWEATGTDQYGAKTFAAPVEVDCIWAEKTRTMLSDAGKEIISNAQVHVTQDLTQEGMLYHGELDDLTQSEKDDPLTLLTAYSILRANKIPSLRNGNEFGRVVYLSERNIQ